MTKSAEDIIRGEWDLLRKSGLLHQLNCTAGPIKTKGVYNMFKWKALMQAPNNSPYKGYAFKFEIEFPENYPNSPPKVFCKTNVYHMNISTTGSVCVSSVKSEWNNAQNINTVLKSIFVIFKVPNPGSPHRSDIANLYNTNMQEYEKNVKENCEKYAIKI
jgi:ubiquitin-conjugating enzyme E2 D/E